MKKPKLEKPFENMDRHHYGFKNTVKAEHAKKRGCMTKTDLLSDKDFFLDAIKKYNPLILEKAKKLHKDELFTLLTTLKGIYGTGMYDRQTKFYQVDKRKIQALNEKQIIETINSRSNKPTDKKPVCGSGHAIVMHTQDGRSIGSQKVWNVCLGTIKGKYFTNWNCKKRKETSGKYFFILRDKIPTDEYKELICDRKNGKITDTDLYDYCSIGNDDHTVGSYLDLHPEISEIYFIYRSSGYQPKVDFCKNHWLVNNMHSTHRQLIYMAVGRNRTNTAVFVF